MSKTYHLFVVFHGPEGIDDDDLDVPVFSAIEAAGGEVQEFILEEQDA